MFNRIAGNCLYFLSIVTCGVFTASAPLAADRVNGLDPQADFYVSSQGDDSNPGTKEKPFATLHRARDAIRQQRAGEGLKKPITVGVRGGKYFLAETLVLTSEDSGSRDCPITYVSYPGEEAILSGGTKITGWSPYQGEILQAKLPPGNWNISKSRQLTFDGKLQTRARWPNFDAQVNPVIGKYLNIEDAAEPGSDTAFTYERGALPRVWKKPHLAEALVTVAGGWSTSVVPVASVDYDKCVVTLQRRTWHGENDNFSRYRHMPFRKRGEGDTPFVMENILEELDLPGEWCLDTEDGMVYFWPPEPLTSESEVVLPRLNTLIDIRGASYVTLSGFKLTETASGDNYQRWGLEGYGAMFPVKGWEYCGEAIHLKDASYCTIQQSTFYALGGNAVYLEGCCLKNQIQHNDFEYVGANGICLLGTREAHPMFNRVEDNRLERTGCILHYTAAIFAGLSDGNLIAHNEINNVPHHGVNFATNAYGRNYLEYNKIGNTCQVLHDTGAVNMWMDPFTIDEESGEGQIIRRAERPGHILRYNYISHTPQGFYLDDWTSNCLVYGNIFDHVWNAVTIHGGKNNIVENNIFYNCACLVYIANDLVDRGKEAEFMWGFCVGNRVRNNIYQSDKAHLWWLYTTREYDLIKDKRIAEAERNLYYKTGGTYQIWDNFEPDKKPIVYEFSDWQKMGYDTTSIIADPMFVDPENGDFRLRPESPAFALGFQPIDSRRIGIRAKN